MEKRLRPPGEGLESIQAVLARLAPSRTPAPEGLPEPVPHWDSLALLTPAARVAQLRRYLRGSLPLAASPRSNRERILEPLPQVFATATELLDQPVSGDPRQAAALPIGLLGALYDLVLSAIRHCCQRESDPSLLAVYLEAALCTVSQLLRCYWLCRLAVPERCWNELHALYQLACASGIDNPQTGGGPGAGQTVRLAYLQPLLMGSLGPTRYRGAEIKQIAAFVERHAHRARLNAEDGLLLVDPNSSRPPGYCGQVERDGCWRLCVRGLVQALDEESAGAPQLVPRLARDLGRSWTRRRMRGELHRRTDQWVELAIGLEAAHRLLTGWGDDDSFTDHLAPSVPGAALPAGRRLHARCIDRSAAGARFRVQGTADRISPGALIAAIADGEARLGVVRWTQLTPEFDTTAGVQWLPADAAPSAVRRLDSPQPMPFLRAFLLPAAGAGHPELVVPAGMFRPADRLETLTATASSVLSLTAAVDLTFHIARFAARPWPSPGGD